MPARSIVLTHPATCAFGLVLLETGRPPSIGSCCGCWRDRGMHRLNFGLRGALYTLAAVSADTIWYSSAKERHRICTACRIC